MSPARKPAASAPSERVRRPTPQLQSVGEYIRRQRRLANVSLRKMAELSGLSASVIKEIESGLRNPSRTILQSLATALRLSAETLQLQAGVIDPQTLDEVDTVREIRRDAHLTERQRDILIEIYRTFRAANQSGNEPI